MWPYLFPYVMEQTYPQEEVLVIGVQGLPGRVSSQEDEEVADMGRDFGLRRDEKSAEVRY